MYVDPIPPDDPLPWWAMREPVRSSKAGWIAASVLAMLAVLTGVIAARMF